MKKISLMLMVFSLFSFTLLGCSKEKDDDDNVDSNGNVYTGPNCYESWASSYSVNTENVSNAYSNYWANPSVENCNALKSAYQKFLDDMKPYQNCTMIPGLERQEFIQEIEEAEEEIDDLC